MKNISINLFLLTTFLCFTKIFAYKTFSSKYNASEFENYDLLTIIEKDHRWEEIINSDEENVFRSEYIVLRTSSDTIELTGYSFEIFNKSLGITGYIALNTTWTRVGNGGMWKTSSNDVDIFVCPGQHINRIRKPTTDTQYIIIADTDSENWMILHVYRDADGVFSGIFVLVKNNLNYEMKRQIQLNTVTALKGKIDYIQTIDLKKSGLVAKQCVKPVNPVHPQPRSANNSSYLNYKFKLQVIINLFLIFFIYL